jgi:fructose-specific phosphotransferase system IIA component
MGGQRRLLPLLVGFGLDEISVALPAIAGLKAELASLVTADCRQLVEAASECATANDVAALMERFAAKRRMPLLEPELVIVGAEAFTKEEAIKQAVDQLYVMGRTERSHAVEEAVWAREATYSTGFGHGFAIPHCKTDAMQFNSLALVKLRAPLAWGSVDDQPVRTVILMAIRESDSSNEHMKVLSRLARQLMHEEFRDRLEQETDPASLCAFLQESIRG